MFRPLTLIVIFASLLFCFSACYYDNAETMYPRLNDCDTTNYKYSAIIAPILAANCEPCHNNSLQSGGINMEGYSNVKLIADNGKLVSVVRWDGAIKMPEAGKLPQCNITLIEKWVAAGAPNN